MSTGGRRPRLRLAVPPSPLVASGVGTTGTSCEAAALTAEPAAGVAAGRAAGSSAWGGAVAPAPGCGTSPPLAALVLKPRRLIGALLHLALFSFTTAGVASPSLRRRSSIASRRAGARAAGSQRPAEATTCILHAQEQAGCPSFRV